MKIITGVKSLIVIVSMLFFFNDGYAQRLISYELLKSYDINQVDSILDANSVGLFFSAKNGIDYYKVLYRTPYKHIDSLVQVSGAVVVPTNTSCSPSLATYFHGTVMLAEDVPSRFGSRESLVGILLAADGHMAVLPDYLGLGDSDSSVIIHPYTHAFSQAHTSVNNLRAARELADSLSVTLNGELFLTGYSQGGFTTVATHKLIEEEYPQEFQVTASAPMSGPYDLKKTQVDLIASDSNYSSPSYLPYILLAYHSVFDSLAQFIPDVTQAFKPPYDTLIPPLFYSKTVAGPTINDLCPPVPKDMVKDSLVNEFVNDSMHPLRVALAESHLLDWTPQAPIKLLYCNGDEQVTYLNSELAYDSWTGRGAQQVFKEDFGNFTHGGCVNLAVLGAKTFIDSYRDSCTNTVGISKPISPLALAIYPNPATSEFYIIIPQGVVNGQVQLFDLAGKEISRFRQTKNVETIDISSLSRGFYIVKLESEQGTYVTRVLVER